MVLAVFGVADRRAASLSDDVVWATVGATVSFSAVSRQPIRVSRMGEVMFRVDLARMAGYEGKTIQIKILNLAPPAKDTVPTAP